MKIPFRIRGPLGAEANLSLVACFVSGPSIESTLFSLRTMPTNR